MTGPRPKRRDEARREDRAEQRADADAGGDESDRGRRDAPARRGRRGSSAACANEKRRADDRREEDHRRGGSGRATGTRSPRGPRRSTCASGVATGSATGRRDLDVGGGGVGHRLADRAAAARRDSGSMMREGDRNDVAGAADPERQRERDGEQHAGDRRRDEAVDRHLRRLHPAVRAVELRALHDAGDDGVRRVVEERLAQPEDEGAGEEGPEADAGRSR